MYRLQINGEFAGLKTSTRIQLNKKLFNLVDLTERGINFTNAINLSNTAKNRRLTGFPNNPNSQAFEQQQDYVLLDGSTVISTGKLIVKGYSPQKSIKVQLAEGRDFWTKAGSLLLNNLKLHDFDFVFNTENMDARKSIGSDVFVTALFSGNQSNTSHLRPCYYWKRLLDFIADDLGYTIDYGNTLQITELNHLGNISNAEKFFVSDLKVRFQNAGQEGAINYDEVNVIFDKELTRIDGSSLINERYKTSYVIKGWVNSQFDTEIALSNGDRIAVSKGASFINYRTDELEVGTSLEIQFNDFLIFEDVYIYSAINESDIFEVEKTIDIDGLLVLADYNLPNQTYKQFIKTIMSLLFLDFEVSNEKKEITVRYLPDEISTNNVNDFSKKVQKRRPFTGGKVYGQLSIFGYQNDEEVNKDFGKAFVQIPNESAPETKSIIMISGYSASKEESGYISVPIYNEAEQKRESVRDRIVYFSEGKATFSPISWQRLYSNHYIDFVTATQKERVYSIEAHITRKDFRSLQRSPLIYVSWLQATLLVTEITGFEDDSTCKMKAIKYN